MEKLGKLRTFPKTDKNSESNTNDKQKIEKFDKLKNNRNKEIVIIFFNLKGKKCLLF